MAVPRVFRTGPPSWFVLAVVCLFPTPATASIDASGQVSTVRAGPLEMVVALEQSAPITGQVTPILICITNRSDRTLMSVPPPNECDISAHMGVNVWRIGPGGTWFRIHRTFTCCAAFASHALPWVYPLRPGGSTCSWRDLSNGYGAYVSPDVLRSARADPTRALLGDRFRPGRYAVQVAYFLTRNEHGWRKPLALKSDTLFFEVRLPAGAERQILAAYADAVDSLDGRSFRRGQELTARWLRRFGNTGLFHTIFLNSGAFAYAIPWRVLISWTEPEEKSPVSHAVTLDWLLRRTEPDQRIGPGNLAEFARADLSKRVLRDWSERPWRSQVRDSVYAERKRELLRGWPPYGTYREPYDRW